MTQQLHLPLYDPQGNAAAICAPLQRLIDALKLQALLDEQRQIVFARRHERRCFQGVYCPPEGLPQQAIYPRLALRAAQRRPDAAASADLTPALSTRGEGDTDLPLSLSTCGEGVG